MKESGWVLIIYWRGCDGGLYSGITLQLFPFSISDDENEFKEEKFVDEENLGRYSQEYLSENGELKDDEQEHFLLDDDDSLDSGEYITFYSFLHSSRNRLHTFIILHFPRTRKGDAHQLNW